jgi:hypothetical protein
MKRLDAALARFDAENAQDPRRDGGEPTELVYGRRMSAWLARLAPEAGEALRLAARAQHLARWRLPRADYPDGRAGYRRWRTECARMHAQRAGEIMAEVGYDAGTIARVGELLVKKRLADDPEVQTLEDVACLVFLQHHLADFARKHERDKLVDIVQKTWKKMSPAGHAAALQLVPELPAEVAGLLTQALG